MKTEHRLAKALKEMMTKYPLDEISVSELSKKCGVSRKTFYYHYHDIYDLLTQVFLDEKIPNYSSAENLSDLVSIVWKYYLSNQGFIDATLNSAGKDLFYEFIYNAFYTTIIKFISKMDTQKVVHLTDKRNIARFYSYGYSSSLVYYLSNYKNKSFDGLRKCFLYIDDNNLEKSVQKAIESR